MYWCVFGKMMHRRYFLAVGCTGVAGVLAGCTGDGSLDDIESNIEETIGYLEDAEPKLETAGNQIHDDDWTGCFGTLDDVRDDLDRAQQSSSDGLELAEAEGHSDHMTVLERLEEYTAIFIDIVDEMEELCTAGQEGDGDEVEQRWETIQALDDDRHEKQGEVDDAISQI